MEDTTLAITLADRSLYPLTDSSGEFYKNVLLTTAKNNQPKALIRFCQIENGEPSNETIGILELDDLPTLTDGELEIDLQLEVDSEGMLSAIATERITGKTNRITLPLPNMGANLFHYSPGDYSTSSTSTSLEHITQEAPNPEAELALIEPLEDDEYFFEEDSEPSKEDKKEKTKKSKGWIILLLLLLLLLGLGGLWWFLQTSRSPAQPAPQPAPVETRPADSVTEPAPVVTVQPEPPLTTGTPAIFVHRIRWGDTLWHLSQRFYGTPWRFPEIAEFNQIPNPDLIIAGEDLEIPVEE